MPLQSIVNLLWISLGTDFDLEKIALCEKSPSLNTMFWVTLFEKNTLYSYPPKDKQTFFFLSYCFKLCLHGGKKSHRSCESHFESKPVRGGGRLSLPGPAASNSDFLYSEISYGSSSTRAGCWCWQRSSCCALPLAKHLKGKRNLFALNI